MIFLDWSNQYNILFEKKQNKTILYFTDNKLSWSNNYTKLYDLFYEKYDIIAFVDEINQSINFSNSHSFSYIFTKITESQGKKSLRIYDTEISNDKTFYDFLNSLKLKTKKRAKHNVYVKFLEDEKRLNKFTELVSMSFSDLTNERDEDLYEESHIEENSDDTLLDLLIPPSYDSSNLIEDIFITPQAQKRKRSYCKFCVDKVKDNCVVCNRAPHSKCTTCTPNNVLDDCELCRNKALTILRPLPDCLKCKGKPFADPNCLICARPPRDSCRFCKNDTIFYNCTYCNGQPDTNCLICGDNKIISKDCKTCKKR